MNGSWPASAGGSSNPAAQIGWMISYIRAVYGDPESAWGHELTAGWYDKGGWLKPGMAGLNTSGRPEAVLTPSQSQALVSGTGSKGLEDRLDRILAAISGQTQALRSTPRQTGRSVGQAVSGVARGAAYQALYSPR